MSVSAMMGTTVIGVVIRPPSVEYCDNRKYHAKVVKIAKGEFIIDLNEWAHAGVTSAMLREIASLLEEMV